MKKLLKICIIFTVVLFAFTMVYAGGEKKPKKEGIIVGFSNASTSNSWRVFMKANYDHEVAIWIEKGVIAEAHYTDADDKPEKQIADVDDLLVKGIDVLIISPAVQDAVNPAVEKAFDMGIPVIVFDRKVTTDKYTTFIETSNYEMGKGQAEWLAKELNYEGKIVAFSGVAGSGPAEDRLKGAMDVFEQHPGIEVLGQQYTDWSPPKAKAVMEAFIQQFPQIDGIWADSGLMSWPALEALKEAGRPLVPSTGEQLNGYAKFVVQNNTRGFIYPFPAWMSREAVKYAIKAVQGEKLDKLILIPVDSIGPDEIKDYVQMGESDFWWVGDDQMPEEFLPKL
jgi:ribose transport system substrate-binding protein